MPQAVSPVIVVDARGLICPMPVLKAQKALRQVSSGEVVRVMATDKSALTDMPAFCETAGHTLLQTEITDAAWVFDIQKNSITPCI